MDSPVQNKNIQHWITNIHGNNCKIEYLEGRKNAYPDMLSCLPHRLLDSNDDSELSDNTFEVRMINSSNINPKTFPHYDHQITDNQCTKEELNLSGYDLIAEKKTKNKELLN